MVFLGGGRGGGGSNKSGVNFPVSVSDQFSNAGRSSSILLFLGEVMYVSMVRIVISKIDCGVYILYVDSYPRSLWDMIWRKFTSREYDWSENRATCP